jgi:valyl-tRNA synthetase
MQLTTLKQSSIADPVLNRLERNGFTNSRPTSAVNSAKRSTVREDDKDLKCINAALETERNRLVNFIQTLQKRLDNTNTQLVEQENKFIEQRKLNVRLEKEMEKVRNDLNNVKNRTGKSSFISTSIDDFIFASERTWNSPIRSKISFNAIR